MQAEKFNLLQDNFTKNATKLNEGWKFSTKPQKLLKFKELSFPDTLFQISPENHTIFFNALSFPSFLSCFFSLKFFVEFDVCII